MDFLLGVAFVLLLEAVVLMLAKEYLERKIDNG